MRKIIATLLSALAVAVLLFTSSVSAFAAEPASLMEVKQADLQVAVEAGEIPTEAFNDQVGNASTRLTKSKVGITDSKMFEVTRTTEGPSADNAKRRLATIYTDRKSATGADAYMYYIELPETLENPIIEIAWNLYQGNNDTQRNGHIYTGTMYVLEVGGKSWAPVEIKERMLTLPTGFKGYVMLNPKECMSDGGFEVGKNFDKTWQLLTTHIYVHNLKNETVTVSAPFMVSGYKDKSFAAYVAGDKTAAKDLFSGNAVTKDDLKLVEGNVIYTLPAKTENLAISQPDASYLPTKTDLVWGEISSAASYSACLFKVQEGFYGEEFVLTKELVVTEAKATFEALEVDTEYILIVAALDADGNEIATSESFSFIAKRGENWDKAEDDNAPVVSLTLIIIIAAAAVVVIVAVVLILLLTKKKKA